jgi:uncharacterized protein YigE (DUF2233 family)
MKQIQLQQNIIIRMNNRNEEYHFVWSKLKQYKLLVIIAIVVVVSVLFFSENNSKNTFNLNSEVSDSSTNSTKGIITKKDTVADPMIEYGNLLKKIKQKNENKKTLGIYVATCEKDIKTRTIKITEIKSGNDTISKNKMDSTAVVKAESIKKANDLLVVKLNYEIDSIKLKEIKLNEQIKNDEIDIKQLNQQLPKALSELKKHVNGFIDSILLRNDGQWAFDFMDNRYYFCVVDMSNKLTSINFHLKNKEGKNYYNISALLKDKAFDSLDFLMITNGGMYTTKNEPQGLFIENGKENNYHLDVTNPNNNTNFYLKPNGVFYIDSNNRAAIKTTEEYTELSKTIHPKYATQSGPMLVINDMIHPKFVENSKNLNIRSGVGIMDDNKVVFVISESQVNFWDFATVFKDVFSCKHALYLDGAISLMYLNHVNSHDLDGNFGPLISVTKPKKKL